MYHKVPHVADGTRANVRMNCMSIILCWQFRGSLRGILNYFIFLHIKYALECCIYV